MYRYPYISFSLNFLSLPAHMRTIIGCNVRDFEIKLVK